MNLNIHSFTHLSHQLFLACFNVGDKVVNKFNRNSNVGFNIYKPCGAPHDVTHDQYNSMQLGFLVGTDTVIGARPWWWNLASDADKRVSFNYDMLNKDSTDVWIWNKDYSNTQKGWHATPIRGGITTNFS